MMYLVKKVRKETVHANGCEHEHIVGVITSAGVYYSNERVASSIAASDEWLTDAEASPRTRIEVVGYCPASDCYHRPYLCARAGSEGRDRLDELPTG